MKRFVLAVFITVLTAVSAFGAVQDFGKFTLDIPKGWRAEITDDAIEIIVEIQNNDNSSSMTFIYGAVSNGEPLTFDEFIKDWPELYNNPSKINRTDDGYYTFTHTNDDGKKAAVYAREVYSGGRAMYYSADMTGKDIAAMKKIRDSFRLKDAH